MADLFHALADPTRRDLLDRLRAQAGLSLSELTEGTGLTRQAVTKHLRILEDANLVTTLRDGRMRRHFLNPVPLTDIVRRWVGRFEDARLEAMDDFKTSCEAIEKDKRNARRHSG